MKTNSKQELITSGIAKMQAGEIEKTTKKFEVAYFIVKEELAMTKYPVLLKLEEKHGVELGNTYRSDMSCATFINFIGDELSIQLRKKLSNANFYSVLTDGSTDVAIIEKEAIFVMHFDSKPDNKDTVQVITSFLRLADLRTGNADGIVEAIRDSLDYIGVTDVDSKLVGFYADGAAVNRGDKEGVKAIIQASLERCASWYLL